MEDMDIVLHPRQLNNLEKNQIKEKNKLIAIIEDIRNSVNTDVIDEAREEIKRLRAMADREIQNVPRQHQSSKKSIKQIRRN